MPPTLPAIDGSSEMLSVTSSSLVSPEFQNSSNKIEFPYSSSFLHHRSKFDPYFGMCTILIALDQKYLGHVYID